MNQNSGPALSRTAVFDRQSLGILFQQPDRQFLGLAGGHPQVGIKAPIFLEIIVGVGDDGLGGACTYDELAVFQLNVRNISYHCTCGIVPHNQYIFQVIGGINQSLRGRGCTLAG